MHWEKSFVDRCCSQQCLSMKNHRRQGLQMGKRATMANLRAFHAQGFGLAVAALAGSSLRGDGVIPRALAVKGDALEATWLLMTVCDAALAFAKGLMIAGFSRHLGEKQRARETPCARARGMIVRNRRMHEQAFGAGRDAIGSEARGGLLVQRNGSHAAMTSSTIGDRPCITGGIGRDVGGEVVEGVHGLPIPRAKGRHIAFSQRLGVFRQHEPPRTRLWEPQRRQSQSPRAVRSFLCCCHRAASGWRCVSRRDDHQDRRCIVGFCRTDQQRRLVHGFP